LNAPPPRDDSDEDAFAKELADGMEALMRELGGSAPSGSGSGAPTEDKEQTEAFMKAWEQLLVEGMGGEQGAAAAEAAKGKEGERKEVEDAFQKTIREAMDRMKSNEDTLQVYGLPAFSVV
jgi:peroxin-19